MECFPGKDKRKKSRSGARLKVSKLSIVLFALWSSHLWATDYLVEGFEGLAPVGWPCKGAPNACTKSQFNGWDNVDWSYCPGRAYWAQAGLSTSQRHSGSQSFYTYRQGSSDESCDIQKVWTGSPRKVYVRLYIYLPSSAWSGFNTPTSKEPYVHFFFLNSAFSGTGPRVNILARVPYSAHPICETGGAGVAAGQPYAFFSIQNYANEWATGSYPNGCFNLLAHLDQWMSVEFMFDSTNADSASRQASIWVNGTLTYTATGPLTDGSYNNVILSNYMSIAGTTPNDTSIYYDDIIVSDSYVGPSRLPSGGASPRLPPPTRLRIL